MHLLRSRLASLTTALLGLASASAFSADLRDRTEFTYDGSKPGEVLVLSGLEKHTVYDVREVPSTCWSREYDGDREECSYVSRRECSSTPVCRDVSDSVCRGDVCRETTRRECSHETECRDVPDSVCRTVPTYRDVAYSCVKTERVAVGEELDYEIAANVAISYGALLPGVSAHEVLSVRLEGTSLAVTLKQGSGRLLVLKDQDIKVETTVPKSGAGAGRKVVTARVHVTGVSLEAAKSAISAGIADVALDAASLKFSVGKVADASLFAPRIRVERMKTLAPDKTVIAETDLDAARFRLSDLPNGRTLVEVPLAGLTLLEPIQKAKYKVRVTALVGGIDRAKLLNPNLLPADAQLSVKQEIKVERP